MESIKPYFSKNISFAKKNKINELINHRHIKVYLSFLYILILIILIKLSISKNSYITLTIKGSGLQNIFFGNNSEDNCDYQPLFIPPDEVKINDLKQTYVLYQYILNETENFVELIWYEQTKITSCACLFYTCENITEIDLSNFNSSQIVSTYRMFRECSILTSINFRNFNTENVLNFEAMFKNCSLLKNLDLSSFVTIKAKSMFRMFYSCLSLTSLDLSNFYSNNLSNIYEMFYDCKKLKYINIKNLEFSDNLLYGEGTFNTSKNLIYCAKDERLVELANHYECAIVNCSDNWKDIQKKINTENDSCIDDCALIAYKYEYDSFCYKKCPDGTIPNKYNKCYLLKLDEEIKDKDELVKNIQEFIQSGIDISSLDNGKDIEIEEEGLKVSITTTNNQKNQKNKNKTSIDFKECEDILKEKYNISKNNTLCVLKIDVEQKGMKIPKIEYEVYYPLYGNELIKLNLNYCKDINMDIFIPVSINGSIDKYNSKSDYYNSICSKTSSDSNIDIPLKIRKKDFIENNLTLCEDNCYLIDYDYYDKKVKCSCEIKINLPLIKDVTIDKEKLKNSFIDIKSILNVNIMKCYKMILTKESLKKNYGSYIIIFIMILFILCFFLFNCKSYHSLKKLINSIFKAKINVIKYESKTVLNKGVKKILKNEKNIKSSSKKKKKGILQNFKKKKRETSNFSNRKFIKGNKQKSKLITDNVKNKKAYSLYKKKLSYTDYELNSLAYKEALIHDKRTYIQYYISLLKINHLLIFSFCSSKDYNSKIIKIFLFFYSFSVHLTINALFFNDSTMNKIYEDGGSFNFIYQIPQIIYSSIISGFLNSIVKYLALSEKNINKFKQEKDIKNLDKIRKKLADTLKIKFILYFVLTLFLLLVFWYYITCFCAIYVNTQIHLIKDSLISFGLSFIYPLGIYIIPGIFRIIALKGKKKNMKFIYGFSKLLAYI